MASRTITARRATYAGKIGSVQFTAGSAVVDDSTAAGKAAIAFAARHGWAVSGGPAAVPILLAEGKNVNEWTSGELTAYLDEWHVTYPSGATTEEKRAAVLAAFEVKSAGGSANPEGTAGHDSGTIPPEGAPPVTAPSKPDDAAEAQQWITPLSDALVPEASAPAITDAPDAISKVAPATATFNVTASGENLEYQWQRQAKGTGPYVNIEAATAAAYTTPATTVADNNGDRYRVIVTNGNGSVTSTGVVLTVTAS